MRHKDRVDKFIDMGSCHFMRPPIRAALDQPGIGPVGCRKAGCAAPVRWKPDRKQLAYSGHCYLENEGKN
jgi:hypothetical protein